MDTTTTYLGKELVTPFVLTDAEPDAEKLKAMVDAGVGAVILRPLLEEELIWDIKLHAREMAPVSNYGANLEFIAKTMDEDYVPRFLENVKKLKEQLTVPLFASVSCYSFDSWMQYVVRLQNAGCDGVELDIQLLPYDATINADDVERLFNDLISTYRRFTSMPLSVKVSHYFTDMMAFMQRVSWLGLQNVTIFNSTPFSQINLEQCTLVPEQPQRTTDSDLFFWLTSLRSQQQSNCTLSAMVADSDDAVRALLCGATTIHFNHCNGDTPATVISEARSTLERWMDQHGHSQLSDFRGILARAAKRQNMLDVRAKILQNTYAQQKRS